MRAGALAALSLLGLAAACQSASTAADAPPGTAIHPQPQPPDVQEVKFASPCTAATCGDVPAALQSPRCKPEASGCAWSDDSAVSYRSCDASECGVAPGPDVCPSGTTLKGSACGSENDAACRWNAVCARPPSTTPCSTSTGCGAKPELGVVCGDGGVGDLACMQFEQRCGWQPTCE